MSETDTATISPDAVAVQTETAPAPSASLLGGAKTEAVAADATDAASAATTIADDAKTEGEGEAKDGESDKPEPITPESYGDFTLPEGIAVDEAIIGDFKGIAAEANLTKDQAQKLVDLRVKQVQAEQAAWQKTQETWVNEVKTDQEIGGENLVQNLSIASKALDQFGTPQLRALLDAYGIGNHPEMVRFVYRVGKGMSEDGPVNVKSAAAGQRTAGDILYPSMAD